MIYTYDNEGIKNRNIQIYAKQGKDVPLLKSVYSTKINSNNVHLDPLLFPIFFIFG